MDDRHVNNTIIAFSLLACIIVLFWYVLTTHVTMMSYWNKTLLTYLLYGKSWKVWSSKCVQDTLRIYYIQVRYKT